ncbi:MAG: 5'-flap endonuclease [Vezdaea acicularis]|nr:MAG: 5'-flap endonuclease [Vezdaea acicularis]
MATGNGSIVVLSSSPPPSLRSHAPSSSPGLPSPSNLLSTASTKLAAGGSKGQAPKDASSGFTSARVLLERPLEENAVVKEKVVQGKRKINDGEGSPGKATKSRKKSGEENVPRKSTKALKDADGTGVSGSKPTRGRPKKTETQAKLPKRKVTKPGKIDEDSSEKFLKSRYFRGDGAHTVQIEGAEDPTLKASKETLDLAPQSAQTAEMPQKEVLAEEASHFTHNSEQVDLANPDPQLSKAPAVKAVRKRTRPKKDAKVDPTILKDPSKAANRSPKKPRAPRKKSLTITALATAAYLPAPPKPAEQHSSTQSALLTHFPPTPASPKDPDPTTKKARTISSNPPKQPRRKPTTKKPSPSPLLSPTSAKARIAAIDPLFGTSSQLARESSPTLVRDIQAALRASEAAWQDPEQDMPLALDDLWSSSRPSVLPSQERLGESPPQRRKKKGLWAAASRDVYGELLAVEIVDLVDTSEKAAGLPTPAPSLEGGYDAAKPTNNLLNPVRPPAQNSRRPTSTDSASTEITGRSTPPPPPPAPAHSAAVSPPPPPPPPAEEKPDYTLLRTAELTALVKKYGFKPLKSRAKLIALLDTCWERTHTSQSSSSTILSVPANQPLPPPSEPVTSADLTRAIKSQPPTHSPLTPSWAEKFLMFDPIPLEELTAWLNTQGLRSVGVGEKVGLEMVKTWVEGRGGTVVGGGGWRRDRERGGMGGLL